MHHANYYYGHAHVLAQYCELPEPLHPPRIQGYLQHGWNIGDGLAPGVPFVEGSPLLVWSEQVRRRAWSQGRRDVVVVGSPFAYLLEMESSVRSRVVAGRSDGESSVRSEVVAGRSDGESSVRSGVVAGRSDGEPEPADQRRDGTIFYPFHGWEGQEVMGDHRRLIDEIKAHESGPITVCLYWNEHRVRAIRKLYERAGFRVICHGYRGFWWRDHDREFLVRQLAELRRHRRVVSNRLCSAIWYGLLAGCQGAVYGDPMVLENADPTFGGEPRLRRQWPEVYGYDPDQAAGYRSARAELGADELAGPAELRTLLGWPALDSAHALAHLSSGPSAAPSARPTSVSS